MKILAVSIDGSNHDFNLCMYDSNNLYFKYIKEERLSGIKHDAGNKNSIDKIKTFKPDLIVIPFGNFKEKLLDLKSNVYKNFKEFEEDVKKNNCFLENFKICDFNGRVLDKKINLKVNRLKSLIENLKLYNVKIQWVQHDYAHILSGWCLDQYNLNEFKYGISIDGGGPDRNNKLIVENPFSKNYCKVLFFSRNINFVDDKIISILNSFGVSIEQIGFAMNLSGDKTDFAGKVMGLNAYGNANQNLVKNFNYEYGIKNLNYIFSEELKKFKNNAFFENKEFLDLNSTLNEIWKNCVLNIFKKHIKNTKEKIIYSGGCAQNTFTNKYLKNIYNNLNIVPHCYDGGLSMGCLAFAIIQNDLKFPKINFPYIQSDVSVEKPKLNTIKKLAKILAMGGIVGWYQGNGEIGPRALGNRSILMDPSIKNGKDVLNSKVKHREHWRPFAPSVLEEFSEEWFDYKGKSKYMMIAVDVKKEKKSFIPSVVHEDGTSRIQTVSFKDNEIFYELLKSFYEIKKIPLLLNTSFNKGGGPIIGNPKEAIDFFKKSKLDALCIGDKLYIKYV